MNTTTKKPRLGRGLDALLGGALEAQPTSKEELRQLPVDLLQRGKYQPRTHMDPGALEELASSIKAQGVVQPIVVRELGTGSYEIIAGERRWRAAQMAGLESVPAVVRNIPDEAAIAIALIENIQRENLNPVEEAVALQRLIDEFGMTHQETAESVGRSRAAVTNLLRLLSLNDDVRTMLEEGRMDMGHARALLGLSGDSQSRTARQVVEKGLSVRETEDLVRRLLEQRAVPRKTREVSDPDVRRLQDELSDKLAARVRISHGPKGRGRLTIDYNSLEELEGVLARIR
ncbi:MAG: ParB/RepB/Spo0J family partition protein [Gammaproteobacteria bacterium]|nr:ParB/RepB/Spo0J family partition protein [Gammaproteobacteria bacterium]